MVGEDVKTLANGAYATIPQGRLTRSYTNIYGLAPVGSHVIDIGCACGTYVRWLNENRRYAIGLDAIPGIEAVENLYDWDLSQPIDQNSQLPARDWAFCLEVGEHIPREYESNFFDNVTALAKNYLVISWARPGKRGYGHVNCRDITYVGIQLARRNWQMDEEATLEIRKKIHRKYQILVMHKQVIDG